MEHGPVHTRTKRNGDRDRLARGEVAEEEGVGRDLFDDLAVLVVLFGLGLRIGVSDRGVV